MSDVNSWGFTLIAISMIFLWNCDQTMCAYNVGQAAERLTVRGTAAGRRPFAMDATSTCSASGDVLFATGNAPRTHPTTTVIAIVVSANATVAAASDKQIS